jgi:hypothetical protein
VLAVSRACIDDKSDGNITRAPLLLSSGLNVGVSSWHCLAGSPNGAAGTAFGVILERTQFISMRRCIHRGGGAGCQIAWFRPY